MKSLVLALVMGISIPSLAQKPQQAVLGACAVPGFPSSCVFTDKNSCGDMQGAFMGGHCPRFQKDDVVLFPSIATSGRAFRMTREVHRVGILHEVDGFQANVQEINYFTRQGGTVWIQTPEGEKKWDGVQPVRTETLVPQVSEVISSDGATITRGSRLPIRIGRSRVSGYVLYVFKNETTSYAAITNDKGWECYTNFGEECHTKMSILLFVRTVSSSR